MTYILFFLYTLTISVSAHSWVACTDYKYGTTNDQNYYNTAECFGYARNWQSVAADFGVDMGFNYQGTAACRDTIGTAPGYGYPAQYPMAQYAPGETVCLAWPSKNHVAASCTNQYIPDTEFDIYINPTANPTADPATFSSLVVNWTDHTNGVIDFKGFQSCPKFCENMDKSLCSRCFTVPNNLAVGSVYTFQWYWIFNSGTTPYTTCWEALITNTPGNSATVSGSTTGASSTSSSTSGSGTSSTSSSGSTTSTSSQPSVTTDSAPTSGDAVVFVRRPTEIPWQAGSTFDIEIAYSTEGERQIVIDILDLVTPTPNWYGKGLVSNINGKGTVTINVDIYDPLTAGQNYIFRCWIVAQGLAEAPQGWAYELDRTDSPVVAGNALQYGSGAETTTSDTSFMKPAVTFVLLVAALLLF